MAKTKSPYFDTAPTTTAYMTQVANDFNYEPPKLGKSIKSPSVEKKVICPYCNEPAEWVDNAEIYGKRYGKSYMMYWCRKDDAYVGCHNNTREPLGHLANRELREWRKKAHRILDPLWISEGKGKRAKVYAWLSRSLGKATHVGESDIETCKEIINFLTTHDYNAKH
jgi:hypothetical protein